MTRDQRRHRQLPFWSRWRTARLRLTLLYGGLVLGSGGALLGITYVLVSRSPAACQVRTRVFGPGPSISGTSSSAPARSRIAGKGGGAAACAFFAFGGVPLGPVGPREAPPLGRTGVRVIVPNTVTPARVRQVRDQATRVQALVAGQDAAELHQVEVDFAIALAIMALVSLAIGWLASGRVLKPLRTITAAAREISASSLDRRLALDRADHELRELGDTFDSLLARLERSFEAQRQFVANASHELRTPLARQRTLVEVALADPDATHSTLRAAHERVLAAGMEQERLIEALLTLASGRAGLERHEPVDLDAATAEALMVREPEAARRRIVVRSELAAAPTTGDDRLVGRLVANLLDNALSHNRPGGSVEVRTGLEDGHAELRVGNTGPIVPADEVGRLMEPFHRVGRHRTGADGGVGLGLSIVEAIALAHGATLAVQARLAGGLDVVVRFPARPTATTRPGEPLARQPARPAESVPRAPGAVAGEHT